MTDRLNTRQTIQPPDQTKQKDMSVHREVTLPIIDYICNIRARIPQFGLEEVWYVEEAVEGIIVIVVRAVNCCVLHGIKTCRQLSTISTICI